LLRKWILVDTLHNNNIEMRNIDNALSDVVSMYKHNCIEYDILYQIPEDNLWVVNVYNREAPGSLLQIEIIDDQGIPKCSVLQKVNVGRKSMLQFMNRFVDALE
jgi:hypothetical protein